MLARISLKNSYGCCKQAQKKPERKIGIQIILCFLLRKRGKEFVDWFQGLIIDSLLRQYFFPFIFVQW